MTAALKRRLDKIEQRNPQATPEQNYNAKSLGILRIEIDRLKRYKDADLAYKKFKELKYTIPKIINALEQSFQGFDINRSLSEWSQSELTAYVKSVDSAYEPQDMSKLSCDELRAIVNGDS